MPFTLTGYKGLVSTHHEVEHTYSPEPDTELPDLQALPGVDRVGEPSVVELAAVYFDTRDLALLRNGVTLRRRVGGSDEGWHLKLPAGSGRDEVRAALGRSVHTPPKAMRDLVLGEARGDPLTAVATVRTHRTERPLYSPDGRVLAELADDEVVAIRADGEPVAWREWELELVDGDPALLAAADELLSENGVHRAELPRKLDRVLGDQLPASLRVPKPKPGKPAVRVIHRRLAEQVDELGRRDLQIRRGEQREGVHKARVACRRLRSLLATFRPMLDREVTDPVRDELRWLIHALGEVRDSTVVRERLVGLLEQEPPDLVRGPIRRRLCASEPEEEPVLEAMGSSRYLELRRTLDRLVADPPWSVEAERPAGEVLVKRVRKDLKRLRRRYEALGDAEDHDTALHDVRKAAKRLRYAAETIVPVDGKGGAKRLARAAKELASHLGQRQDTVVSREQLLELVESAVADGEPTFTYGRLHAREERRAAELDSALPEVWGRTTRAAPPSWL